MLGTLRTVTTVMRWGCGLLIGLPYVENAGSGVFLFINTSLHLFVKFLNNKDSRIFGASWKF